MIAQTRLSSLTSLRFFAALLVLCQHYFGFSYGHAGVSFFFVLSGFILTYNYADRIGVGVSAKSFYWKRFARIYPTHFLTLMLAVPISLHVPAWKGEIEFVANALLVQSFVPFSSVYFSFNAPSWSISDEAFFYAIFPLILGFRKREGQAALYGSIGLIVVISTGWILVWRNASMYEPVTHWLFYINPVFRLVEFAIGIGLGLQFKRNDHSGYVGTWQELGVLLVALSTITSAYMLPRNWGPLQCSLWFIPAATALVWVFARSRGIFADLLSRRPLLLLGEASFMLYMIHTLVLQYARLFLPVHLLARVGLASSAIVASLVMHLVFEAPIQRWLSRGASREVAATAP